ncbi:hypothetical protein B9Q03_12210 [Candidatus Marsarchaeota G2 archaeon OSP_D]|uniref:WsaF C-terminal domain-containing protein n=1 Tax=Candidatus Marsarchaeota G2 archaeon OSP_D TaxID=1978157 RepID=A0A2R6AGV0_9ARCH|nr:MAG: hypothetical protein B9Q03_12210 [Candidatus Marsarchaeota G2 archaeon OSP_D]
MGKVAKPLLTRLLTKPINYLYKKFSFESELIDELNMIDDLPSLSGYESVQTDGQRIASSAWIVPSYAFDRVYGGAYVVARFMCELMKRGVETKLILYSDPNVDTKGVEEYFVKTFGVSPGILVYGRHDLPAVDAVFAMNWESAYMALRYRNTRRRIYFVLEYDPGFYQAGAISAIAHESYRLPLELVVYGIGLARYIEREFAVKCHVIPITVDSSVFHPPSHELKSPPFNVFFYARPRRARNGFSLGVAALRLAKQLIPELHVYSAGEEFNPKMFGLDTSWWHNLGYLGREKTAEVYKSCHASLVFCFTRATSIVALEAMACGSLLVTNRSELDSWLTNDGATAISLPPHPNTVAEKLHEIWENYPTYREVARRGQKHASHWEWNTEVDRVLRELGVS